LIAANNVVHLLVKICLPLQHGIEIIGAVRALFGADHRDTDDITPIFSRGWPCFSYIASMKKGT
jgi:hypothetical protein